MSIDLIGLAAVIERHELLEIPSTYANWTALHAAQAIAAEQAPEGVLARMGEDIHARLDHYLENHSIPPIFDRSIPLGWNDIITVTIDLGILLSGFSSLHSVNRDLRHGRIELEDATESQAVVGPRPEPTAMFYQAWLSFRSYLIDLDPAIPVVLAGSFTL